MLLRHCLFYTFILGCMSCVPRAQYDTLATERDYYRQQIVATDSSAGARSRVLNDSLQEQRARERRLLRQVDELTATNRTLQTRVTELNEQYTSILEQNRALVADSGGDEDLRQELLDRQAELEQQRAELERRDRQLRAREESLASLDRMRAEQPETYDSATGARGTSPVDPQTDALVRTERLQDELRQLMLALTDTGYVLRRTDPATLELILGGQLTFTADNDITLTGQRILRRLGGTLRNYPGLRYTVIGHAESVNGDALRAYEDSATRAIRVATQLGQFGIDAGTIVAGAQGFYGPDDAPQLNGLDGERRLEIVIRSVE